MPADLSARFIVPDSAGVSDSVRFPYNCDSDGYPAGAQLRVEHSVEMDEAVVAADPNLSPTVPGWASPGTDLTKLRAVDLLALYDGVLCQLLQRGLVRSTNNPVADYAESLVAQALRLQLVTKSTPGYDAIGSDGTKYEIKARRATPANGSRQLSVLRGLRDHHFDYLVGVLFAPDFQVLRGCVISVQTVEALASYRKHVNGWVLHLRDNVWHRSDVRDVTAELIAAQQSTR
jgi:hypothetical protein